MGLIDEIREQPDVSRRLLRELPPALQPVVAAVTERGVAFVTVVARGTSDHAGIYAQYALGGLARLPVGLATPSLITRYGTPPRLDRALVIGISQSGRSPDVVGVMAEARRQGGVTVAVTNDPASPLADAAEHGLPLMVGEERSVAATKTYTASLLVVAMLAAALSDERERLERDLARLPGEQERALASAGLAGALAPDFAGTDAFVTLGRGYNLATAFEWALKLKELSAVYAQGYSTADFQHGPVASVAPGGAVLAIRAGGPLLGELDDVLRRLARERHARIVVVSAEPFEGAHQLPFPDQLPEWLSPLVAIVPGQLFAAAVTVAKGLDTDRPAGLTKVTLTR
jgi:glucosamine--fructose-6-phosphate aminotransferase (isomerizing)